MDARRNREQIIAAAREVFLEQGIHAPLEEIARRAGVGIATLYRRFPDRHTLVRQVALDNLALVGAELDRATATHPDAWGRAGATPAPPGGASGRRLHADAGLSS